MNRFALYFRPLAQAAGSKTDHFPARFNPQGVS